MRAQSHVRFTPLATTKADFHEQRFSPRQRNSRAPPLLPLPQPPDDQRRQPLRRLLRDPVRHAVENLETVRRRHELLGRLLGPQARLADGID